MKTVNETLTAIKGAGKETETITGKGSFSQKKWSDLVNAMGNDSSYTTTSVDKTGKTVETNISELIRSDIKKSVLAANCPQKSEISVLDSSPITTDGIAQACGHMIMQYIRTGSKFEMPAQSDTSASLFIMPVEAKTKTVTTRDMKTQEVTGSVEITNKECYQVRCQSKVPKHLLTKVKKDVNGKVIND